MGKKLPYTPKSRIASWIRRGWTQSRERAKIIKEANYTCNQCGRKQSRAKGKIVKIEVHHIDKINWENVIRIIREEVLDKPQEVLCKECHHIQTEKQNAKKQTTPKS
jgi:5-methylcytosine-specific restriction endonuclease McrA